MRSQRILILSSSVVLGVTLADANPVQAPGWTPLLADNVVAGEQMSPTTPPQSSGLTTVGVPEWASGAQSASAGAAIQAPSSVPATGEVQSVSAPSPADDWSRMADAVSTGYLPSVGPSSDNTIKASTAAAGADGASVQPQAGDPGGANPFVDQVVSQPQAPLSGATANPFELQTTPDAQPPPPASTNTQPFDLRSPEAAPASTPANADAQQGPDLRALRYYASQRNLVRVGAEIRRLKALYPTWQVPDDLFSPVGGVEEQALWDLYAIGNYAEIRRRITTMQAANPQWRPSSDLLSKLEFGETRARINAASNAGSWNQVVSYAATSKGLLVCTNMDSLWRVAEALVKTSKLAEAFNLYRYILSNCADPHERMATFQKASFLLPSKGMDALLPLAASVDEQTSFASIRFDQLRGKMGAVASGEEQGEIGEDELGQFARYIDGSRSAADATLFGWYLYRLEYFEDSAAWFKAASQVSKDPKPLEGYILSLRNLDQIDKAQEIAYKNRNKSPEIAKVYIELVAEQLTEEDRDDKTKALTAEQLKQYEEAVDGVESPLGAQAIGWHYIDAKDLATAQEWFDKSVKWEPTEGGVVGQAVIAARYKRMADLQRIKSTYQDEFPALKDFKVWKAYSKVKYSKKYDKKYRKAAAKPKKSFLARLFDS
jgi:hypothetical protein